MVLLQYIEHLNSIDYKHPSDMSDELCKHRMGQPDFQQPDFQQQHIFRIFPYS